MTSMSTRAETEASEQMQEALLRRCHDTLSAFSEREFERNVGHTYVPGCVPPALADRSKAYVQPDSSKQAYREATHLGGQGIILAQPPASALERAYVDQPLCRRPEDMVPGSRDAARRGCGWPSPTTPTPDWGRVHKRSNVLTLDYADEPTIKCETPTECDPALPPRMPNPNDNGPGTLQNAMTDVLEAKPTTMAGTGVCTGAFSSMSPERRMTIAIATGIAVVFAILLFSFFAQQRSHRV